MKKTIVGEHEGPLYCMDMACKFVPEIKPPWYGHGFAIGDRAWTHVWMLDWRERHPDARLILTDRTHNNVHLRSWAASLDAHWLGQDLVDEIWETDYPEEPLPDPRAYPLYHVPMGRIWKWLRRNSSVQPTIRPKKDALERADMLLKKYGVPPRFITLQPLFDASYNTYRNAPPSWWGSICQELSRLAPVVVVGAYWNAGRMPIPSRSFPLWEERLSSMETLAIVSRATAHVGGETGVTIWAPIFKVPTLALYKKWRGWEKNYLDVRPISFGAPVMPAALCVAPTVVTQQMSRLWRL